MVVGRPGPHARAAVCTLDCAQDGYTWMLGLKMVPAAEIMDASLPLFGVVTPFLQVHGCERPAHAPSATVASDAPSAILAMSTTRCTAIVRVVRVRSGCELCAMMRVNAR